jgi:hydrogenase maturation protease
VRWSHRLGEAGIRGFGDWMREIGRRHSRLSARSVVLPRYGKSSRRNCPRQRARVLVAGVGNVLRGDDGFGPAVINHLEQRTDLPPGVRLVEVGIGGIHLVHELMAGFEGLILVDAVDRTDPPGSLYVLEPKVPPLVELTTRQRYEAGCDMHQAVPARALIMAQAVNALPPQLRIVGCQPAVIDDLIFDLSPPVQKAVPTAVNAILSLLRLWTQNGKVQGG